MKRIPFKLNGLTMILLALSACEVSKQYSSEKSKQYLSTGTLKNTSAKESGAFLSNNKDDTQNHNSDFPFDQIAKVEINIKSDGNIRSLSLKNRAGASVVIPAAYELDEVQAVKRGNFMVVNFPRVDASVASIIISKAQDGIYRLHKIDGIRLSHADLTQSVLLNSDGSLSLSFVDSNDNHQVYTTNIDSKKRLLLVRE